MLSNPAFNVPAPAPPRPAFRLATEFPRGFPMDTVKPCWMGWQSLLFLFTPEHERPGSLVLSSERKKRKQVSAPHPTRFHSTRSRFGRAQVRENVLLEERAVLLGRIGDHTQALHIYIHKLGAESGQRMAEVRPPPRVRDPITRVSSCPARPRFPKQTCVVCEWP